MTAIDESHCARCLRVPGPQDIGYRPGDDLPPAEWEALTDSDGEVIGVVCPDCLTPAERQALDEDVMDMMDLGEDARDEQ